MADIEKVKKGLESCTTYAFAEKETYCKDLGCPYLSDGVACWGNLNKDALELLKEQEAVKPIRKLAYTKQGWFCGNCDNRLNRNGKYCSFCGKPILWEGR